MPSLACQGMSMDEDEQFEAIKQVADGFGSDLDFIYPLEAAASSQGWRLTPDEPEPSESPEQLFFHRAKAWGERRVS
eukprot:Skav226434  [mRNA]  locus=scaffold696:220992:222963:+ [translate_table: standard]